jgi:imidazole glycerol-phosphate synthase subunit HisF
VLTKRIIACLDVDAGRVVKGVQFLNLRDAGDPAALARAHSDAGADEIVLLDITATHQNRATLLDVVRRTARELFIPFTVGGGIRSLEDAAEVFDAGADKIAINSAAVADPSLIARIAARFGSQAVVVAVDAKRESNYAKRGPNDAKRGPHAAEREPEDAKRDIHTKCESKDAQVYVAGGRTPTGRCVLEWVREAEERGAGEILLTSMDRDGTRDGFDCELTAAVASAVQIPVIASGGAGSVGDFEKVFREGRADAALAASIFHFGLYSAAELKQRLHAAGIPVRWPC